MKIKNKFLNKIIAKYIIEPIDEYSAEFYEIDGISLRELKKYLHIHFNNFLFMIYDKCPILEWMLCSLCEAEMQLKAVFDKEFKDYLDTCNVGVGDTFKSQAMLDIPKNSFYCSNCPFSDRSKIASFIFGEQSSGYCYYLGKGDFTFINPTTILWDGCKECGINEDIEEENEEAENE